MIKMKCSENNSIYKKYCRPLKMSIFKTNCSPRFHSIGLDNLREVDPVFLAISLLLICGKTHFFFFFFKRLSYICFLLWILLM
jgi:hypothetical protein